MISLQTELNTKEEALVRRDDIIDAIAFLLHCFPTASNSTKSLANQNTKAQTPISKTIPDTAPKSTPTVEASQRTRIGKE